MEQNVKFEFLYRDSGNYKQYGAVIFSNQKKIPIALINQIIYDYLTDQLYFFPQKLSLPNIRVHKMDTELDVDWYEFENCIETSEIQTDDRDINEFLEKLKAHHFGL